MAEGSTAAVECTPVGVSEDGRVVAAAAIVRLSFEPFNGFALLPKGSATALDLPALTP